jgi:predicted nucleotide-binding protein
LVYYLQNTLKLDEPAVLQNMPNEGKTLIEKFESEAELTDLVFVLLTPDDELAKDSDTETEKYRARQNVIFEMGFFLGKLGRKSGKILLLHKGPLDIPSDIAGIGYIDITSGIESAGEQIRRELRPLGVLRCSAGRATVVRLRNLPQQRPGRTGAQGWEGTCPQVPAY